MPMARLVKPRRLLLKLRRSANPPQLRVKREEHSAPISTDARLFVWARDGGQCRHCGSIVDLQFDHIIPRSWGGSGTANNVELLCGGCNKRKGARLS
jgi:5-methylcytosine-specific restriction endonuclease McrA